jgi:hypothetical protein
MLRKPEGLFRGGTGPERGGKWEGRETQSELIKGHLWRILWNEGNGTKGNLNEVSGDRTPNPSSRTGQLIIASTVSLTSTPNSTIKSGIALPKPPTLHPAESERNDTLAKARFFLQRDQLRGSFGSSVGCGISTIEEPGWRLRLWDAEVRREEKVEIRRGDSREKDRRSGWKIILYKYEKGKDHLDRGAVQFPHLYRNHSTNET